MGSNMAENHPVGFQWVVEARERGAQVIHIDPRFTRTSAMATRWVGIRAGSDIAFLGGVVNYVLAHERWFHDYVVKYTNAPVIIKEDFKDVEELDGLFSGWDPEQKKYDIQTWQYEGVDMHSAAGAREKGFVPTKGHAAHGAHVKLHHGEPPSEDPSLTHPRCVFQILKRHYARYTPEFVADACGCTVDEFLAVAEALCENSGRERTSAFVYSVGWTQHTVGVQYIRTASIIQLLLGNIGRPGGGVIALRGHASIQGSTDIPVLYDMLPGYLPQPRALAGHTTLADYLANGKSYLGSRGSGPEGMWHDDVILFPAASIVEKNGSLTNTERMIQWHDKAVDPAGDSRPDTWFSYNLGKRLKELYKDSSLERDAPLLNLTWDYEPDGDANGAL